MFGKTAYRIGKYEVTAGQYTEFLNAVAADDTYVLYGSGMEDSCGIKRNGLPASYTYSVAFDWVNRPVTNVGWDNAARFANWLQNGQPTGAQNLRTTEDGAYYLNGATSPNLMTVTRESDATWFIPTEDEWYKAAYHKNDGVTGNYWDYPTGTNSVPSNDLIDPDPGNSANFYDNWNGTYTIGDPYWTTEVGEFENSASPYGTFDQAGNLWELSENVNDDLPWRLCGGSWANGLSFLRASNRGNPPLPAHLVGFRVASIPEPGTAALFTIVLLSLLWWRRARR